MATRSMRRPNWPAWVFSTFTPKGLSVLERSFVEVKTSGVFERGTRISAEDHATAVAALLRSEGRTDLLDLGVRV